MSIRNFQFRPSNQPLAGVGWRHMLELANCEHEVVNVVRDFVSSLNLYEVGRLPPPCRPGKFFHAEDVTSFALDVVRYQCEDDQPTRELVHKIAAFFSDASTRLSQLMARTNDPPMEMQQSA